MLSQARREPEVFRKRKLSTDQDVGWVFRNVSAAF